jgi:IMP dehydrogenase
MLIKEGLTFDDVLLVPNHSEITTRADVSTSVKLPKIDKEISHPIIPANMKTIIDYPMAEAIYISGGLAILHRFMPLEEQISILTRLENKFGKDVWKSIGFSIGVKKEDFLSVEKLVSAGARILCIDIAHGHSRLCIDMCEHISDIYPNVLLIAGNVATNNGAFDLWAAGADIVKVGVGPGSLCTTRIETGNGVPQLTALIDAIEAKKAICSRHQGGTDDKQRLIISDGGIKNTGDIVKALCFADLVMIGNMFAGCEETPGETLTIDGRKYKEYVGSSTHKTNHIEGVAAIVPAKGSLKIILTKMLEGIQSGCSYQGVMSIDKLKDNPTFIRITGAGLKESHAHDVIVR